MTELAVWCVARDRGFGLTDFVHAHRPGGPAESGSWKGTAVVSPPGLTGSQAMYSKLDTRAPFSETSWTLLDGLRDGDEKARRHAREKLITIYWPAVYAFLRRKGHGRDEAIELTQAFFTDKVLERELFGSEHPSDDRRGRSSRTGASCRTP